MDNTYDDELRKIARKRLKRKADFKNYLFVWAFVSALLTGIWFFATPGTFFWPLFGIAGMGIAALFIAWDAYGPRRDITEADIDAELERLKKRKA
jgi:uncharacterized membrane protein